MAQPAPSTMNTRRRGRRALQLDELEEEDPHLQNTRARNNDEVRRSGRTTRNRGRRQPVMIMEEEDDENDEDFNIRKLASDDDEEFKAEVNKPTNRFIRATRNSIRDSTLR